MFQISNQKRPNNSFKEGDTVANDKKNDAAKRREGKPLRK